MDRKVALLGIALVGLVVLALVAAGASSSRPRPPAAPSSPAAPDAERPPPPPDPVLLPDMRSLDAFDIAVEVVGAERRLRFSAALANLGPGPLVLEPRGTSRCRSGRHAARQVVHVDATGDGRFQRGRDTTRTRRFAGCMLRHRGHDHWHFDAMAAYSLRRPAATRPLVARHKVSFCLRDNRRAPGVATTERREHFGDCTATTPQGISPGWVDVYSADLDGQWLRLPPGVGDEVVCLDLAADPRDLIREVDETDNATSVALRISGSVVRRLPADRCAPA